MDRMKEQILAEIRRLSEENGSPPGQEHFTRSTGISSGKWRGVYWARWSDALVEAGYEPNQKLERFATSDVLSKVAGACRHYHRFPTKAELKLYRRIHPEFPSHSTIDNHFRSRNDLLNALTAFVNETTQFQDVAALLPSPTVPKESTSNGGKDGSVYLLRFGKYYKIGRSDEIERRLKEIRTSLPDSGELIHSIRTDDPAGIEAYWHRRFAGLRANGEWFKLGSKEIAAFRRRTYQ